MHSPSLMQVVRPWYVLCSPSSPGPIIIQLLVAVPASNSNRKDLVTYRVKNIDPIDIDQCTWPTGQSPSSSRSFTLLLTGPSHPRWRCLCGRCFRGGAPAQGHRGLSVRAPIESPRSCRNLQFAAFAQSEVATRPEFKHHRDSPSSFRPCCRFRRWRRQSQYRNDRFHPVLSPPPSVIKCFILTFSRRDLEDIFVASGIRQISQAVASQANKANATFNTTVKAGLRPNGLNEEAPFPLTICQLVYLVGGYAQYDYLLEWLQHEHGEARSVIRLDAETG